MFRRHYNSEVPTLNTSSTADISFMLLIFFLVTSSMDSDKGLQRQLPPPPQAEQRAMDILDTDILTVSISGDNRLTIDGQDVTADELTQRVREFAAPRPEQRIILVESSRKATYEAYFRAQDAILRAYHQLKCPPRISETVTAEEGGLP